MKPTTIVAVSALLILGVALPVASGEYKCEEDLATCAHKMAEHLAKKGWIGISMDKGDDKGDVSLEEVVAGSPADKAGLQVGDVLLSLNGIQVSEENKEALMKEYKGLYPGQTINYRIRRDGEELSVDIELVPVPRHIAAQWIGKHILDGHVKLEKEAALAEKGD
jgi:C-terminal processing protease CtpA/Prc